MNVVPERRKKGLVLHVFSVSRAVTPGSQRSVPQGSIPASQAWKVCPGPRGGVSLRFLAHCSVVIFTKTETRRDVLRFSFLPFQVGKSRPRDLRSAFQPHRKASGPSPWSLPHAAPRLVPLGPESGSVCLLGFSSVLLKASHGWPGLCRGACVTAGRRFRFWASVSS